MANEILVRHNNRSEKQIGMHKTTNLEVHGLSSPSGFVSVMSDICLIFDMSVNEKLLTCICMFVCIALLLPD